MRARGQRSVVLQSKRSDDLYRPPQNTLRKPVEQLRIEEAQSLLKENGIPLENVIVHAPYIINLGNVQNPDTFELGVRFLKQELARTAAIGAWYLVLHPGSSVKATAEEGLARIIEGLNQALEEDDHDVLICLETMAGKGSELGWNFEQLRSIREGVTKKERIAFVWIPVISMMPAIRWMSWIRC